MLRGGGVFSPFSDPFMLSVDASGVVPVGVRPPPPLRGSSPYEVGQFIPAAWDLQSHALEYQDLQSEKNIPI